MQTPQQDCGGTRAGGDPARGEDPARGAAAPGVPSLVNNPPNAKTEASGSKQWTDQQCKIRRACIDRIRYWQSHSYEVLWVTLTSASELAKVRKAGAHGQLREDFRELRRRVGVQWGLDQIEYICVETSEGNGVLHMLWAARANKGQFYIPQKWLSQEWEAIHGAWNVWVARVREGKSSTRRLSRYIVSQYCGGQDGLVRLSQSRMGQPFGAMRRGLLKAMKACTDRFLYYGRLGMGWDIGRFGRICNQWYWHEFRHAWDDLVLWGECEFFGCRFVWWLGELCPV